MARKSPGARRWDYDTTDVFDAWFAQLAEHDEAAADKVDQLIELLQRQGPTLGRPYADRLKGSTIHNLKELRPSSREEEALRILFYFDPTSQALLILGGNKAGNWTKWYDENIPKAEAAIKAHEMALKLAEDARRTVAATSKTNTNSSRRRRKK